MNEDIVELAFEALDHHDVLYHKPKELAAKVLPGRSNRYSHPDQGTVDPRRHDGWHDEGRNDRPRNDPRGLYAQRGRRASSFDNGDYGRDGRRDRSRRAGRGRTRDYYDSESSVSPRRHSRPRGGGRSKSEYSSSSSSLISSSEDDRRGRKIKIKDLMGAGLAAVATINAASGLYSSMDDAKKRHEAVKEGKLSQKEARRLKNTAKIQDLAAVGVAALSLKSVYSRWQETRKTHADYHEYKKAKERRHQRRLEQGY